MAQDFKKLHVWQEAHKITVVLYKLTSNFPKHELYGLTQQLRRAAMSVELNIAEGAAGGSKQFLRYLRLSLGSNKEVECCILIARDLQYITPAQALQYTQQIQKVQGMLTNLIQRIQSTNESTNKN